MFRTTRWSLVLETRAMAAQARDALDALCRIYRPPVLAYIRRHGYPAAEAEDLTQAFFEHLLNHRSYARADPERGRFRAYLLTALKRFLASQHAYAHALKRGGGHEIVLLDSEHEPGDDSADPEQTFERSYALTVIARALEKLEQEAITADKAGLFGELKHFLLESPDSQEYAQLAAQLRMRRNTLAVAIHRLRARLRDLVRLELADTVDSAAGLDAEMASLRSALDDSAPGLATP